MKRTWTLIFCGFMAVGFVGCSDDDGGAACGDDVAEGNEVCDGIDLNGNVCSDVGNFTGGTLACNATCTDWDTSQCISGDCGNGQIDTGEICDGANLGGNNCPDVGNFTGGTLACNATCDGWDTSQCTGAFCGNDQVEGTELCDGADLDNNQCTTIGMGCTGGTLACNNTCDGWDISQCTNCQPCGNDQIDTGELCDGADLGGENCTTIGAGCTGGTLGCNTTCDNWDISQCTGCTEWCGNDTVEGSEVCDGADLDGEDCQSLNFSGGLLYCSPDCATFDSRGCFDNIGSCGDGVINFPESCDGTELGGTICDDWGFTGGTLACTGGCTFDFSGCTGDYCQINNRYGDGVCDPCEMMGGTPDADCGAPCGADGTCASYIHTQLYITTCVWANGTEDPDCGPCGNDQVDEDINGSIMEWCDGTDLGLFGCADFGFVGGQIDCTPACTYDVSGCTAPVCGDNVAEGNEECDGTDLRGMNCQAFGYTGGTLVCAACVFDTNGCTGTPLACPGDDTYEENDDFGGAAAIAPPVSTGGIICSGDDDYFSFTAPEGDIIDINLAFVHAVGDLDLYLYDSAQTQVAYSGSTSDGEQISYQVPVGEGGTYYVRVYGFSNAEAPYGLDVDVFAPVCGNNTTEGNEVCDGTDIGGLTCADLGFMGGGTLDCLGDCSDYDTSNCIGPQWTCALIWYGDGSDCDCGCGVLDPDCADATAASCDYCNNTGSCDQTGGGCPGIIDPTQNWLCT